MRKQQGRSKRWLLMVGADWCWGLRRRCTGGIIGVRGGSGEVGDAEGCWGGNEISGPRAVLVVVERMERMGAVLMERSYWLGGEGCWKTIFANL